MRIHGRARLRSCVCEALPSGSSGFRAHTNSCSQLRLLSAVKGFLQCAEGKQRLKQMAAVREGFTEEQGFEG